MLDKIKQWTLRVLDWSGSGGEGGGGGGCQEEDLQSALKSLQECRQMLDPRELPRPHRYHNCSNSPETSLSGRVGGEGEDEHSWCCRNCNQLTLELLECAICLEPLTSSATGGVTSCLECGNIACMNCATRLQRCPYCRTEGGLAPNPALQRLLYKLDIPCRNSVLPVRCPHKKCEWRGDIDSLSLHLERIHMVTILNGSSVTLDIADFQRKAELSETRPRHYSVLLACFSDVFVCKVSLHHNKLKVVLSQLTRAKHPRLAAWVEISCISKTMKGIIPLSKNKSDIELPVTNFVAPVSGTDDRVSISINIRPLS